MQRLENTDAAFAQKHTSPLEFTLVFPPQIRDHRKCASPRAASCRFTQAVKPVAQTQREREKSLSRV